MDLVLQPTLFFMLIMTTHTYQDHTYIYRQLNDLQNRLSLMERLVMGRDAYCSNIPAEICGPCVCRDDPITLKKHYCDCQTLGVQRDCLEFYRQGVRVDGIYQVNQSGLKVIQVFCDQTTADGGWTVIQRRVDGRESFGKDWQAYAEGFGYLQHEHWLGNINIHTMELQSKLGKGSELRVDMEDWEGKKGYAMYSMFQLGNEQTGFKLHVSGYNGTAGDSLSKHSGRKFTTIDKDNDVMKGNCAATTLGGWWYIKCHPSNLNGVYLLPLQTKDHASGILWYTFTNGHDKSLKKTEMKIRRKL